MTPARRGPLPRDCFEFCGELTLPHPKDWLDVLHTLQLPDRNPVDVHQSSCCGLEDFAQITLVAYRSRGDTKVYSRRLPRRLAGPMPEEDSSGCRWSAAPGSRYSVSTVLVQVRDDIHHAFKVVTKKAETGVTLVTKPPSEFSGSVAVV